MQEEKWISEIRQALQKYENEEFVRSLSGDYLSVVGIKLSAISARIGDISAELKKRYTDAEEDAQNQEDGLYMEYKKVIAPMEAKTRARLETVGFRLEKNLAEMKYKKSEALNKSIGNVVSNIQSRIKVLLGEEIRAKSKEIN